MKSLFILLSTLITFLAFASDNTSTRYLDLEVFNVFFTSQTDCGRVVYAYPGERILGQADCISHRPTLQSELTQGIVGFHGIGAQDGIGNGPFTLVAPQKQGVYEVRFRYAQAYSLEEAIQNWWNVDAPPPVQATIGLVIVTEDPTHAIREINDDNWREWLKRQHPDGNILGEAEELLTADLLGFDGFWDRAKATGPWQFEGNQIHNGGTLRFNKFYQIVSQKQFRKFDLTLTTKYHRTRNLEKAWWSHSRGFGIVYYFNDQMNVEFRYFADVGQLSLYIRDQEKVVELIKPFHYPQGQEMIQEISVERGIIVWRINGQIIFQETTTLRQGHLMLTNHNNSVTFTF